MSEKTIYSILMDIQERISVPKDQYNSFGGYKYRNAETILKAAKPLLKENRCLVHLSDDIVEIGGNNYLKSTATLIAADLPDGQNKVEVSALAREAESKKGMDASQVTGATSSYARKYALCGLFAIDDGVDNDSLDNRDRGADIASEYKEKAKFAADRAIKKIATNRIDFSEIRAKLKTIDTVEALNVFWKELHLSEKQASCLLSDFSKRKEEINGMD